MQKITLTIDSNPYHATLVGQCVQSLCAVTPLAENTIEDVQLCVMKGIQNVIVHSYENQAGHEIAVQINLEVDRVVIDIEDKGKGLEELIRRCDINNFPDFDPLNLPDLSESELGFYLINATMDTVSYEQEEIGRVLRLTKLF